MRDRREDPGQYYPGGSVVQKTPTGQGGGGTSDYSQLANKPKINNHELTGNKTAAQLGLATPSDIPDVSGKRGLTDLDVYEEVPKPRKWDWNPTGNDDLDAYLASGDRIEWYDEYWSFAELDGWWTNEPGSNDFESLSETFVVYHEDDPETTYTVSFHRTSAYDGTELKPTGDHLSKESQLNTKLDKTGGEIRGSLTVYGDITSEAHTITADYGNIMSLIDVHTIYPLLPSGIIIPAILDLGDDGAERPFGIKMAAGGVIDIKGSRTLANYGITDAAKQSDIPALAAPSESATDAQAAKAKSTYDFVNSSINAMAAFYITKNAAGDSFATKAELTAAIASGTFYNGGQPRVPTKNDYLYILADESHPTAAGTNPTTRYSFDGTQWAFQIVVNDTALTAAQLAAMNSGINAALVTWLTTFKGTDTATTLASVLAKMAHLESDGTADDDFATDLLGKQAAKEAIDNRTKASASAITGDALILPDGGVVSASSSAPTITFGTARQTNGLRFCELYLTNPDAAADGAIVSISGKVYSDISLTDLPKLEKGATYYFTFAEFKVTQETVEGETVSVSHWKASKQKLDAMGGDIPTSTAA